MAVYHQWMLREGLFSMPCEVRGAAVARMGLPR